MRAIGVGSMLAASALAVSMSTSSALAGAFGLRTQSTIGLGQAFAGNASGAAGLSSLFWNPATITMRPGYTSEYNLSVVSPEARITVLAPTPTLPLGQAGDIAQTAIVPATYSAYQVNEQVWLGLASAAPFGNITKPNVVWAGQTYSRSSRVTSLNFAPIIGVKVNEVLSLAIGPTVQYFKVRLNSASGPTPSAGTVLLEGDDFSAGFTAGATLTPMPGTVLGVGFRSSIHHEIDGTLRTPLAVTPVKLSLNLPEQLTVGLTKEITPELKLSAGFEWMNWSRLGSPAITSKASGAPITPFPLNYKDGFIYSVGGEYQIDPHWAVRLGVAYEQSPIDISNRSTRLPDTDRVYASVGASYRWNEKLTVNGAYSRVIAASKSDIRIVPGNALYNGLPFFAETDVSVDVFSLSLTYRWDDPKVAVAAPVTRKY